MESSNTVEISWADSDPATLRAHHLADALEREGPPAEGVHEEELSPEGSFQGGLMFTPPDPVPGAAIIYFHGGGFIAGSPRTHRCVTSWLAALSAVRVLSARYRLTPENRYPAQRDDAVAAVERAAGLADATGGAPRLFLCGDSAGACVALWGLHGLPAALRAKVAGLALLYGGYGLTESPSVSRFGTAANGLDTNTLRIMYQRLVDGRSARSFDSLSPLGFASEITEPTYILAAEMDAVFDDSRTLHAKLVESGSPSLFESAAGMDHGFLKEAGKQPSATAELEKVAKWIDSRVR
ncbi:alpha/beta hydrolase fold domain-containing protein [Rhodospirillaceae bacterium SYSU D60014]|uniref:alpha/beta hydrolase n=1 Tax=Virgifigura deserti TaxID=2268457 RepID=UPI000E669D19